MYTNHRHYILITIAIATISISVLGDIFLYRSIISKSARTYQAEKEISIEDQRKKREQDLQGFYSKSLEQRMIIAGYTVSQDKIVNFIEALESIGKNTGTELDISGINNDEIIASQDNTPAGHLKAHLDVSGQWGNVMRTMILIENMPYSVSVTSMRLSQSSTNAAISKRDGKLWKLSLDIIVLTTK